MEIFDPQIQILDPRVVDQIAAGEVVERPAQLVKELVENSLDAGATQISVEFGEAGRFVRVKDNGRGIQSQELAQALDRFATSKITQAEDLWKLQSFGFRGEALASISAVSRLTLISKTARAPAAAKIISDFGQRSELETIGGDLGTVVQVERLFENIPARLKFLKSASAESTQIKMVLKALALSHPEVEFRVLMESELVYFWSACLTKIERARQVLEIEKLYEGSAQRESVRAYSVFADPNTVAKTSKQMWFLAQNRWVQDRGLQAGVMEAYRHLLMHGEYPISVTWVETDPNEIDVNIHPTKAQVKFLDPSLAFRAVQASVRDTLEKAPWLENLPLQSQVQFKPQESPESINLKFESPVIENTQYRQKLSVQEFASPRKQYESPMSAPSVAVPTSKWTHLQILGQAHLTYLIAQSRTGLMLIDQHAAHERVLFEKLQKNYREGKMETQNFLFPLAIDLTAEAVEALLKESLSFLSLGLVIEQLGPQTLGVLSAPALIKESVLAGLFEKASQEILQNGGSYSFERSVGDLIATMACHSAVRAGQALSTEEIRALFEAMDEFPLSSFCPHGRPVYVEYSLNQLEKDFGRVTS